MVKHIVMFNVKEGEDKDQTAAIAAKYVEPLVGQIPGLLHAEVRRCYSGMDFVLYSEFESKEACAVYADHPLHIAAKNHFFHLLASRVAADYEL